MLATGPWKRRRKPFQLPGNAAKSGDMLIWDLKLLRCGREISCVSCTGAYTYSMANNYNRNRRPAVVFVQNGSGSGGGAGDPGEISPARIAFPSPAGRTR